MKIPNTPVTNGNGYYNPDSGAQYGSDQSDGEEVDTPVQGGDFSEYLWMENEEEFDSQVLKQLEEEALMEQCIEAMLDDERDGTPATTTTQTAWSNNTSSPSSASLVEAVESLSVSDDELAKTSTLNPNATEFVPRQPAANPIEGTA